MYPNSEAIGAVFNIQEAGMAQLAFEITQATTRPDSLPPLLAAKELKLPAPDEEGCVVLDQRTTSIVLCAAKIACSKAEERYRTANIQYVERRADHADLEEVQFLQMGVVYAKDDAVQLKDLYLNTEACLLESEDMFIDRGLSRQMTDS